ncbi:MAG: MOSC domain-containing protein [Planctomycetaceae bacterium]|jgi:hypothetical protein|nr:MOSC domain-containing protein [Planctomycetaceae bacterium]MBT4724539.1 MOSC domain-containing protein [Planctomycetaceae bacterium]MBT4844910.1 MOSC domain-containing protein [Planctomycetaceae bacterium]MBT5125123.1 MOSC domain-containing protein [Planctomycetaceae bacterium]MBT5597784.1 MOSC domain-containing protein [Planctomycetaceae bacterium]
MSATIQKLTAYPIKSFDGVDLEQVTILPSGGIQHDRLFAFTDTDGNYFNGKNYTQIHRFETHFINTWHNIVLVDKHANQREYFDLITDQQPMLKWIQQIEPAIDDIEESTNCGITDDRDAPGPTIISTATLKTIASWFDDITVDSVRRRLRCNIEVDGVPAFWEDRFLNGKQVLHIGELQFLGTTSSQRCVVPTRDPDSGEPTTDFAKTVRTRREQTLPAWSDRSQFDHFFRLATNTIIATDCHGGTINVGDQVT